MQGAIKKLTVIVESLPKIFNFLLKSSVCLLFITMITTSSMQVFTRYVLNRPLGWTEEITRYLFVWLIFLGSSIALQKDSHFSLDLLLNRLSSRLQSVVQICINTGIIFFLYLLFTNSLIVVRLNFRQLSAATQVPMAWFYLAITFGTVSMLLITLSKTFVHIKNIFLSRKV